MQSIPRTVFHVFIFGLSSDIVINCNQPFQVASKQLSLETKEAHSFPLLHGVPLRLFAQKCERTYADPGCSDFGCFGLVESAIRGDQ